MSQQPSDMRAGVNKLCGEVRSVGMDPTNGDVYVFVGSSRKLMKLLHWERGGYVMYYKRLEQGRFHRKIFLRFMSPIVTPIREILIPFFIYC